MFSSTAAETTEELDTRKMMQVLETHHLIPQSICNHAKRGVINIITQERVPPEVTHDLLNARTIGQADYEATVEYHFLKDPSIQPPKRKRRPLTLKGPTKKISKVDEEAHYILYQKGNSMGRSS